ncbi:hypothetical protein [Winogradskya consettensis]|uniref:hypothetical protein n=1 Tax=Winogradskya consettensis TaxID=113560 RepID=UPI001BB374EE|nr:hypothetical protein [Actinoplanes consettensis]
MTHDVGSTTRFTRSRRRTRRLKIIGTDHCGPSVESSDGAEDRGEDAGNVYLESEETIVQAEIHFETWDGPADFAADAWQRSDVIMLDWPSGSLALDQITAGAYRLPSAGPWHLRLA